MAEKYESGEYPGMCFGDYDPGADECLRCDLRRECKMETEYERGDRSGDTGGSEGGDGSSTK